MTNIIELANRNFGALAFLTELEDRPHILAFINESRSLRGASIYVLWSDLCDKDISAVERLIAKCPRSIIEDACSRHDHSGVALIKPYLS
jgi:hypothetical protein